MRLWPFNNLFMRNIYASISAIDCLFSVSARVNRHSIYFGWIFGWTYNLRVRKYWKRNQIFIPEYSDWVSIFSVCCVFLCSCHRPGFIFIHFPASSFDNIYDLKRFDWRTADKNRFQDIAILKCCETFLKLYSIHFCFSSKPFVDSMFCFVTLGLSYTAYKVENLKKKNINVRYEVESILYRVNVLNLSKIFSPANNSIFELN